MTNTPEKMGLLATKICSVYFATCQMNLFVCINHFYLENNKGSLLFRCNENEGIVVVVINGNIFIQFIWFASTFK